MKVLGYTSTIVIIAYNSSYFDYHFVQKRYVTINYAKQDKILLRIQ